MAAHVNQHGVEISTYKDLNGKARFLVWMGDTFVGDYPSHRGAARVANKLIRDIESESKVVRS